MCCFHAIQPENHALTRGLRMRGGFVDGITERTSVGAHAELTRAFRTAVLPAMRETQRLSNQLIR